MPPYSEQTLITMCSCLEHRPVAQGGNKLWLLSQKFRSGECGHFMKASYLMHEPSPTVKGRPDWAPKVGYLGVAIAAAHSITGVHDYMGDPLLSKLVDTMMSNGWDGKPFTKAPYSLLYSRFTENVPLQVNHIRPQDMMASSFHRAPPRSTGFAVRTQEEVAVAPPLSLSNQLSEDEESDGEGELMRAREVVASLRAQLEAHVKADESASSYRERIHDTRGGGKRSM